MHLHIKKTSKIIKPSSLVDKVFVAQGFCKKIKADISYYHLQLKDSITNTFYELQIPFEILYLNRKEPFYKIQEIVVYSKSPLMKNKDIPMPVINAANEKVYETISYLETDQKK